MMWGRCPRHSRCDVGQVPQAQSPHWPPPPLPPLRTETTAGRSSASLTHCSFVPYWTYLTPSYWTDLTPSYWTDLTPSYWTDLTPSFWTDLTPSYWTDLTPSYWTDLTPSYWTVLTPSYSPGPRYRRGPRCQGTGEGGAGNSVSWKQRLLH